MNTYSEEQRGSREVPRWLFPIYFPLFLIAGVLSFPIAVVMAQYFKYTERRFVRTMKLANRIMDLDLLAQALEEKRGTLIEEWLSEKGPVRCWWVDENVPAISPHAWTDNGYEALFDTEYKPFSIWRHREFVAAGKTLLLSSSNVPEMQYPREDMEAKLAIPVVAIATMR